MSGMGPVLIQRESTQFAGPRVPTFFFCYGPLKDLELKEDERVLLLNDPLLPPQRRRARASGTLICVACLVRGDV